MRPTISACMIVKNESKYLRDCLESIHFWVDEIILVDTGSTDDTVKIGLEYAPQVFHYEWQNDFSAARNHAFSLATKDWCFVIDADERFSIDDIGELLAQLANPENGVLQIQVWNLFEDEAKPGHYSDKVTKLNSPRFFRRSLGLKYVSAVHNYVPLGPEVPGVVWLDDVRLYHLGYANFEEQKIKNKRRLDMIGKWLREHPEDGKMHFQMAQTLRFEALLSNDEADWRKMIEHCSLGLACPSPVDYGPGIKCQLLEHSAFAYYNLKDYENALKDIKTALDLKPDYLDAMWLGSQILMAQGRLNEAKQALESYIVAVRAYNIQSDRDNIIMFSSDGLAEGLLHLGAVKRALGDVWGGDRDIDSAVKLKPSLAAKAQTITAVTEVK